MLSGTSLKIRSLTDNHLPYHLSDCEPAEDCDYTLILDLFLKLLVHLCMIFLRDSSFHRPKNINLSLCL